VKEWLTTSGALNCATDVGSIPMIDTLVQKGLGKALLRKNISVANVYGTYVSNMNVF